MDVGEPEAAERALRRAAELAPQRLAPWTMLTKLYCTDLQELTKVRTPLEQAINLVTQPHDMALLAGLAMRYEPNLDLARALLTRASREFPEDRMVREQSARFYLNAGTHRERARQLARALLDEQPDSIDYLFLYVASMDTEVISWQEPASTEVQALLRSVPPSGPRAAHAQLALARIALLRHDPAPSVFRMVDEAVDLAPDDPSVLGQAIALLDGQPARHGRLRFFVDHYLEVAQAPLDALLVRAWSALVLDADSVKSVTLYRQAQERAPESIYVLDGLVMALMAREELAEAETLAHRLLQGNPQPGIVRLNFAELLLRTGRVTDGIQLLDRHLSERPSPPSDRLTALYMRWTVAPESFPTGPRLMNQLLERGWRARGIVAPHVFSQRLGSEMASEQLHDTLWAVACGQEEFAALELQPEWPYLVARDAS